MKQILFFATPVDILPLLERFQSASPLQFAQGGPLSTPDRALYLDATQIPGLGIATHETGSQSRGLLVAQRDVALQARRSVTRQGEPRWNLFNADVAGSVSLVLGGLWKTGTLLPGSMATMHADPAARQLMKRFASSLKQEGFTKVRAWWLGKDAMAMLRDGKRLSTTAEQPPPEFDLRLSDAC